MEMEKILFSVFIFLIALLLLIALKLKQRHKKCKFKLPPGSMGWPYIGETPCSIRSPRPTSSPPDKEGYSKWGSRSWLVFSIEIINRAYFWYFRHGEIFKTHILGCPCVILASSEAARFVLVSQAPLFKPRYPKSKENLIGPSALFFHQGSYHMTLRKLVSGALLPQALKNLVSGIEKLIVSSLDSISDGLVVNTYAEMKKLSFEVGIMAVFGHLESHYKEELKKSYGEVDRGYNSFPVNLPGTKYHMAMKARKKLSKVLKEIMKKRKGMTESNDLLSSLMNFEDENGGILGEEKVADNVIGVLFAAKDTTASAMTWVIKFLHDHPKVRQAVKAEHEAINQNKGKRSHLTWNNTRNMPFTHKVIMESLRMASILSFTFREAVEDVEYKGYLIPKGWKVMPLFRSIHHNAESFSKPQIFDPSRFETSPKPNTFMPFGCGVHACPGNELAKLELLILIHHLVTNFRYELTELHNAVEYGPFPIPRHGLPARFWKQ